MKLAQETVVAEKTKYALSIDQIQKFLPHRTPFLLVDRVLEIQAGGDLNDPSINGKIGTRVVATKCVSYNEPYFAGHFPGFAILPGVLLIETMAQVATFSLYPYVKNNPEQGLRDTRCVLVGIDSARFRKPVIPGDKLTIETVVSRTRGPLWAFDCKASVDGQLVAEAKIMANWITDSPEKEAVK
ncbi:MAG: 3-hydroxyacyl-[acyl-carrier-protein] dehydratase FabZ [Bdellovibrionales bacterium GWB1_55_8]|nr:MAG: 3-hydroxyacyl-[acyl-carrier-protein] dehydratase FabZ [Bdellovibrionales bacterium GWB1_55_8]